MHPTMPTTVFMSSPSMTSRSMLWSSDECAKGSSPRRRPRPLPMGITVRATSRLFLPEPHVSGRATSKEFLKFSADSGLGCPDSCCHVRTLLHLARVDPPQSVAGGIDLCVRVSTGARASHHWPRITCRPQCRARFPHSWRRAGDSRDGVQTLRAGDVGRLLAERRLWRIAAHRLSDE